MPRHFLVSTALPFALAVFFTSFFGCTPAMKADMAMSAKNYDQAIDQYQQFLESNPDSVVGRNRLGYSLLQAGRFDEAAQQFKKVLEIMPGQPYASLYLGLSLVLGGEPEEGAAAWEEFMSMSNPQIEYQVHEMAGKLRAQVHQNTTPQSMNQWAEKQVDTITKDQLMADAERGGVPGDGSAEGDAGDAGGEDCGCD